MNQPLLQAAVARGVAAFTLLVRQEVPAEGGFESVSAVITDQLAAGRQSLGPIRIIVDAPVGSPDDLTHPRYLKIAAELLNNRGVISQLIF